jgi:biopolymer transport protein ExbB/TolQ
MQSTEPLAPAPTTAPPSHGPAAIAHIGRSTLVLPSSVPASLRAERIWKVLVMAFGLAVAAGVGAFGSRFAKSGSVLSRLLDVRSIEGVITVLIAGVFAWALALCAYRYLRLRALERLCRQGLLVDVARELEAAGTVQVAAALSRPACQASPLLRRAGAVVEQWVRRPSLQDADVVLQHHAVHDEESVRGGYSLLGVFVWGLPVLGLIGTVIMISGAVGDFARFVGASQEDLEAVKQSLVGVTTHLSVAFLMTLQGLLASLFVMFLTSALQSRELKLFAGLERSVSTWLLPALQRVHPVTDAVAAGPWSGADLGEFAHGLRRLVEDGLASAHNLFGEAVAAGRATAELIHAEQTALRTAVDEIRQSGLFVALDDLRSAVSGQSETALALSNAIRHLAETTARVIGAQDALHHSVNQLHEAGFERVLGEVRDSLNAVTGVLEGFRRPFVLQAVPVAVAGGAGHAEDARGRGNGAS